MSLQYLNIWRDILVYPKLFDTCIDYDEGKDLLVSGSYDKSIAFMKLEERIIIKKHKNLSNEVRGIKFI
jgi:hypothetical protein